jgi:hypothetical protein
MTGAVRKQRLAGWVFLPVALLLFCAAFAKKDDGLLLAGVMATVVTAVILIFAGPLTRSSIRKNVVKVLGTADPVEAECELADDALVFRKMGHELRLSWKTVVRIEDSATTLDIFTQPMGLAMIPKRIFAGTDEINEWVEFIKQHMEQGQQPSQPIAGKPGSG